MIRVLALDPGGTTGLCYLCKNGRDYYPVSLHLTDPSDVMSFVYLKVSNPEPPNLIAIERFVVSRRAGRSSTAKAGETARNIIGAVQQLCQEAGVPLVQRSASQVKAWATDKRLDAAGLLAPTKGLPHARDAARHALFAAVWDLGLPDPLSQQGKTRG